MRILKIIEIKKSAWKSLSKLSKLEEEGKIQHYYSGASIIIIIIIIIITIILTLK
jgi:hypothetical protein